MPCWSLLKNWAFLKKSELNGGHYGQNVHPFLGSWGALAWAWGKYGLGCCLWVTLCRDVHPCSSQQHWVVAVTRAQMSLRVVKALPRGLETS